MHEEKREGVRCKNKVFQKGACKLHPKDIPKERSGIDGLLKAGQFAGAVTALIKLIEELGPAVKVIERIVQHSASHRLTSSPGTSGHGGSSTRTEGELVHFLNDEISPRHDDVARLSLLRSYFEHMQSSESFGSVSQKRDELFEVLENIYEDR